MPTMLHIETSVSHLLNKCLLNIFYVPGTAGCARESVLNIIEPLKSYSLVGKKRKHR